ncbi:MAG: enoyl-CoA hydratase-related protein [Pseudomonadota bacterium]
MGEQVVKSERKDRTLVLTVDFPPSNALAPAVRDALSAALAAAAADEEIWTVIITATGEKFFMAGANIPSLLELDPPAALARVEAAHAFMQALCDLPKPTIAAINGYCLGGGLELALCCDIRIAAEHARLGLPETALGLMPGGGGTQRLPAIVGQGFARHLIFSAGQLTAAEALGMGLVQKMVPSGRLKAEALALAATINRQGPLGVRAAKQALNAAYNMPLDQALATERRLWADLFASQDLKEGLGAFLAKREPDFRAC